MKKLLYISLSWVILLTSCKMIRYKTSEVYVSQKNMDNVGEYKLSNNLSYLDQESVENTPSGVPNNCTEDEIYLTKISLDEVCFRGTMRNETFFDKDISQYNFKLNKEKIHPLIKIDSVSNNEYPYEALVVVKSFGGNISGSSSSYSEAGYASYSESRGYSAATGGSSKGSGFLGNLGLNKKERKDFMFKTGNRSFSFCTDEIEKLGIDISEEINLQIELKVSAQEKFGSNYIWKFN